MKILHQRVAHYALAACALVCTHVYAATFCAKSQTAIQNALTTAASNGEADDIRIPAGTYTMSGVSSIDSQVALAMESTEAFAVTISGGWNSNCSVKTYDQTELNGDSKYPILFMESSGAMQITVTDLIFEQAGFSAVSGTVNGSALDISTKGNLIIERNQFILNQNNHSAAVFSSSAESNVVLLRNNLFYGNQGVFVGGAYLNFASGGIVAGNTFLGNNASDTNGTGGAFLDSGSGSFTVANNIFYSSTSATDLDLAASSVAPDTLLNNDIDVLGGSGQSVDSKCNFKMDPQFGSGLFNVHLSSTSPLVNAGYDGGAGVLGDLDLGGDARVTGAHADIGAYETDVIFRGVFETKTDLCAVAG